jgi:hypothetical protein
MGEREGTPSAVPCIARAPEGGYGADLTGFESQPTRDLRAERERLQRAFLSACRRRHPDLKWHIVRAERAQRDTPPL